MSWIYLLAASASAAVTDAAPLQDFDVFREALSHETFNEIRCNGMSAERTKRLYNKHYKPRQDRIRSAIVASHGNEYLNDEYIIAIGFPCPRYKGAEKRLKQFLSMAEKRLNIPRQ